jgi:hypothetical protein
MLAYRKHLLYKAYGNVKIYNITESGFSVALEYGRKKCKWEDYEPFT